MKTRRTFWLILLVLLCCACAALAEQEEQVLPKYEEMLLPVDGTLLARYSTTTGPMKAAGVTFEISDSSIATVNQAGYVHGVAPGECTLTIRSNKNPEVYASIPVRIYAELKKLRLSAPEKTLDVGGQMRLEYALEPESVTGVTVAFSSNKEDVATVDESGLVTAVGRGKVTITAAAQDGKKRASVRLEVRQGVEKISFASTEYTLSTGGKKKLKATVLPANANNKKLIWSSTDESIAKVDRNGNVKALAVGDVQIIASSQSDAEVCAAVTVHCVKPAQSVSVQPKQVDLQAGQTFQLHPVVLPEDATIQTVAYDVQNREICSVSADGLITPRRTGQTTVRVFTVDGSKCETSLVVRTIIPAEAVLFLQRGCRVGAQEHAFANLRVLPSGSGQFTQLHWESSDPSIASVSGTDWRPRLEGHRWGRCTLTGTTANGALSASIQVNVGALHKAVSIASASRTDGKLRVTLRNDSNLTMKEVCLRVQSEASCQDIAVSDLHIASGATSEVDVALADTNARKLQVAVGAWQTEDVYYDNNDSLRDSYRIAPGQMTWHEVR